MPASATATAPESAAATSPQPTPDAKAKANAKPEAKVHAGLESVIVKYDDAVEKAESYYIEIIEVIQSNKISRADVVATLMKARKITFETAQAQYSRMKGIWQNPEVLKQLKDGEITLKMAREKTTKKQAGTTSTQGAQSGASTSAEASKETKEARYERCQKAHVAAVKECGYDLKSAIVSFEASLKAAGVK